MSGGLLSSSGHEPTAARPFAAAGGLWLRSARALLLIVMLAPSSVLAQTQETSRTTSELSTMTVKPELAIGAPARASEAPCIQVDIAGNTAGRIDCAAARLDAAAKAAQARAGGTLGLPSPDATSADVVTGVANQTATRQRMGDAYGRGVRPQRPLPPAYPHPRAPKP